MTARLRPRQRLRTRAEFDRVFRRGVRLEGRLFVLIAAPNGTATDRLGLTVNRRVGGAVLRNRVRRLLRESFRRLPPDGRAGFDVVLVARSELVERTQSEVDIELRGRLRRLRGAPGRAGAAADPPH